MSDNLTGRELAEIALAIAKEGSTGDYKRKLQAEFDAAMEGFTGSNWETVVERLGKDHPVVRELNLQEGPAGLTPNVNPEDAPPGLAERLIEGVKTAVGQVGQEPLPAQPGTASRERGDVEVDDTERGPVGVDPRARGGRGATGGQPTGGVGAPRAEPRRVPEDEYWEEGRHEGDLPKGRASGDLDSVQQRRRNTLLQEALSRRSLSETDEIIAQRERSLQRRLGALTGRPVTADRFDLAGIPGKSLDGRSIPAPHADSAEGQAARFGSVGLPEGFLPEINRGNEGGLRNPDAIASRLSNPEISGNRVVETDANGNPLGEDGEPLVGEDGQLREGVKPLYRDTYLPVVNYDETSKYLPLQMTAFQRRDLQLRMVRAGMAPEGAVPQGQWTPEWSGAFETVLAQAMITGVRWQNAMSDLEEIADAGEQAAIGDLRRQWEESYVPDVKPDPASLRLSVYGAISESLNRDPTPAEMEALMGQYQQFYRQSYDSQRQVAMAQAGQGLMSQHPLEIIPEDLRTSEDEQEIADYRQQIAGEFGTPGEVEHVDPQARFALAFQDKFGDQIKRREQRRSNEDASKVTDRNLLNVNAMLRGGT